jgi:uncharacterized coiled-coil DUF342 family protein
MNDLVNELKRQLAVIESKRAQAHERVSTLEAKVKEGNSTMRALLIDLAMCRRENAHLKLTLEACKHLEADNRWLRKQIERIKTAAGHEFLPP